MHTQISIDGFVGSDCGFTFNAFAAHNVSSQLANGFSFAVSVPLDRAKQMRSICWLTQQIARFRSVIHCVQH